MKEFVLTNYTWTLPDTSPDSNKDPVGVTKIDNSPSSAPADSWEDAVDVGKLGSPFKTNKKVPIDETTEEILEDDEEKEDVLSELEKTKTKKKINVEPTNKVKKEHVNLVIIGHVGKYMQITKFETYLWYCDIAYIR